MGWWRVERGGVTLDGEGSEDEERRYGRSVIWWYEPCLPILSQTFR